MHDAHRQRKREQMLQNGPDSFADHELLEFLLYYSIPRKDTNELAHILLERFGTLRAVLEAPRAELLKVPGVGDMTATLLGLIPQVYRRAMISDAPKETIINSVNDAGRYLLKRFIGERNEVVYQLCLDAKGKVLSCAVVCRGSVSTANLSLRKVVENALTNNAVQVILAHNHPSGLAIPSEEDNATTIAVRDALKVVGVTLVDHIIVADGDFVSTAQDGLLLNR